MLLSDASMSMSLGTLLERQDINLTRSYIDIRENLFQFLCYFPDSMVNNSGVSLWIDQLCINQQDRTERNCHVRIMASIYESASMFHPP
jgi:hypothetical protein